MFVAHNSLLACVLYATRCLVVYRQIHESKVYLECSVAVWQQGLARIHQVTNSTQVAMHQYGHHLSTRSGGAHYQWHVG